MPTGIKPIGIKALPPRPQKTRTPEEQKTLEQQSGASVLTQLGLMTAFDQTGSKGKGKGKGGFGALTGTLMALPIIGGLIGTFVGGSSSSSSASSTKTDASETGVNQNTVVAAGIVIFSSSMLLCCCVLLMVLLSSMQ